MNSDVLRDDRTTVLVSPDLLSVTNRIFDVGEFWYGTKAVLPKQVPI